MTCCRACRSSFPGICHAPKRQCGCHAAEHWPTKEPPGPSPVKDPTGNRAVANVDNQRKKNR